MLCRGMFNSQVAAPGSPRRAFAFCARLTGLPRGVVAAASLVLLMAAVPSVAQVPDLTIGKSHVGNFTQGQIGATYVITVSNLGPGDVLANNTVTVTDTLPIGLTATSIFGLGWSCIQPGGPCSRVGGSSPLAAGASYPAITLTVNVAPNAPASVTNTVAVSGGGELNTANDSTSDPTLINAGPDLTIGKSHVGNFTQGQIGATYVITVSNLGPGDVLANNTVTVTDTLPIGLTATSIFGLGWSCIQPGGPCSRVGGSSPLAAGASYPAITLTVNVAPNAPASVTNTVAVSGGGELNTANDSTSDPTLINAGPDLTIGKSHVGNFTQGQIGATYVITVSNLGPGDVLANNTVTVTDTLPIGLTATSIFGLGWSCIQPGGPCSRVGGSSPLAAGASYPPLTLTVNVAPNAPTSVTNGVTVSGGSDIDASNNSASDPTTINSGPDLIIASAHSGNFTQGQIGAAYTVTVGNIGSGAVQPGSTVTVTDALPIGLAATNSSGGGWVCTQPGGPCNRSGANAALAPGSSYPPLTFTVDVAGNAPTSVSNGVTLSGGGDANPNNNSASDPTTVTGPASRLVIMAQPSNANAGAAIAPPVTVQVQDAAGLFVTSSTALVTIAIGNNPGSATLGGTVSTNAVGGVATFGTLALNKGGAAYTLTAIGAGLASATSSQFNILATPALLSASSRKTHGTAGTFDLALALTPLSPTTEPRSSATQSIVLTFDTAIASATPAISEGTATFGSMTIAGNDVILNYTGVTNAQYVTFALGNVVAAGGGPAANVAVRVGFLVGDANQSRQVTVADVGIVNAALLQTVANGNFTLDTNVDGKLTVADKGITNANLLKKLPSP